MGGPPEPPGACTGRARPGTAGISVRMLEREQATNRERQSIGGGSRSGWVSSLCKAMQKLSGNRADVVVGLPVPDSPEGAVAHRRSRSEMA